MSFQEAIAVWTDREPTLDEELSALSEDDLVEMAYLPPDWTGVLSYVFISTALGQHGPRVKVYVKKGRHQPSASISIGPNPRVLASSLDERDLCRIAPLAIAWVALNHEALTTTECSELANFQYRRPCLLGLDADFCRERVIT